MVAVVLPLIVPPTLQHGVCNTECIRSHGILTPQGRESTAHVQLHPAFLRALI